MKIIILGAGQVGGTLAEHLADEQNDITVVDTSSDKLRALHDRLDIGAVTGEASPPNTLFKAGADDADMLRGRYLHPYPIPASHVPLSG